MRRQVNQVKMELLSGDINIYPHFYQFRVIEAWWKYNLCWNVRVEHKQGDPQGGRDTSKRTETKMKMLCRRPFQVQFFQDHFCILIRINLQFVFSGLIESKSALAQVMV